MLNSFAEPKIKELNSSITRDLDGREAKMVTLVSTHMFQAKSELTTLDLVCVTSSVDCLSSIYRGTFHNPPNQGDSGCYPAKLALFIPEFPFELLTLRT